MKKILIVSLILASQLPLILYGQNSTNKPEAQSLLNKSKTNFFIENKGQWPKEVRYLARIGGMNAWITNTGVVYDYYQITRNFNPEQIWKLPPNEKDEIERKNTSIKGHVVNMKLEGANINAESNPSGIQESYYNFFIGNDPAKWASFVKLCNEVLFEDVYPGIDIRYYFDKGLIRYDYIAKPGAVLAQINLKIMGSEAYNINEKGELTLKTSLGDVQHGKLYAYQQLGHQKCEITCSFSKTIDGNVGVTAGDYNPALALVIDPLIYSTFIGGSTSYDEAYSIAIDGIGNAFITGKTGMTSDYPTTTGAYDVNYNGDGSAHKGDGFITKLNASGTALVYSTFIGGSSDDEGWSIAIDGSGNAFLSGNTSSSDYPTTSGAYNVSYNGGYQDVFVTKLNASGSSIIYSTFIGGDSTESCYSIAINNDRNAFIMGSTQSIDYPTTSGAFDVSYNFFDVFVTKLNVSGSALVYSTYIGGSGPDYPSSITIDNNGNAYCTGYTGSKDFPTTTGAYDESFNDSTSVDAFVSKLNSSGSALIYSTYLGGSNEDRGKSVKVDGGGNAYITGWTASLNYPTTIGAYNRNKRGTKFYDDIFVTKLNPSGSALVYSTYIGGSMDDQAYSIAIDGSGNAFVTGGTRSSDYPVTAGAIEAIDVSFRGWWFDAFFAKLNSTGSALLYSTILGGNAQNGFDYGNSIAVDDSGNAFIAGSTQSPDFSITAGAYDTSLGGNFDVFVTKILPINQASGIIFKNSTTSQTECSWIKGGGIKRAVFIRQAISGLALPVNNITYTANSTFGSGTQIGVSGWYCIYNDTGSMVTIKGLSLNNTYRIMVCEYIGIAGNEFYITDSVFNNPVNYYTSPTIQASNISFTNISSNSFWIKCTKGNGTKRALFVKSGTTGNAVPVNDSIYSAAMTFGSGSQISNTGWYCVYNDTGNSAFVANLQSKTSYTVMACEYNGSHGSEKYNTNTAINNPNSIVTVGIDDNQSAKVIIYPNPTNGLLIIENSKGCQIKIFNTLGETIYNKIVISNSYTADLKNVSDGIYFLKLEKEGRIISQEIILKR